jgi:hypothetical protein
MVRAPLILVTIAAALGLGLQQKKAEPPPLPPLNEKVFEFAKSNLGKPVGDGICITLAVEALREAGARRASFRDPKGDYEWGELVPDMKDALPGDILQFRDAVFKGQRSLGRGRTTRWHAEYLHHTAIVAKVERQGKLITIYHQNVATKGKGEAEKGNVQEGELRMESLQKGGWVKAYRPVPAGRARLDPEGLEEGPTR